MRKAIKKIAVALSLALVMAATTVVANTQSVDVQAASRKKVKKISFKAKTYYVLKGKTLSLSSRITYSPKKPKSKKVTWYSYKKKVATVSSKGKVKAKRYGTAKIRVRSTSNKKAKAYCYIKVVKKIPNLAFTHASSATVVSGDTYQLKLKSLPSYTYVKSTTYKSSNTSVATVSSKGLITAKGPGTATITVTKKGKNTKTLKFTMKVTKTKITKAGTYNNLKGNVIISKNVKGTVTLNNCDISLLELENGDYEVNAAGTTKIGEVKIVTTATATSKAAQIAKVPTLRLSGSAKVTTVNATSPMNVVVASNDVKITNLNATSEVTVSKAEGVTVTKEVVETVTVNTTSPIDVAVPTTNVAVAKESANVTVSEPVTNLSVTGNSSSVAVNADVTTVNVKAASTSSEAITLTVGGSAQVSTVNAETSTNVVVASDDVKVTNLNATSEVAVSKAEGVTVTKEVVETVTVNTTSEVVVAVPTTTVEVAKESSKVTVSEPVTNLSVTGNSSSVAVNADVKNIELNTNATEATKPAITVKVTATVTEVKVTSGAADVENNGQVENVKVDQSAQTGVTVNGVDQDRMQVVDKEDKPVAGATVKTEYVWEKATSGIDGSLTVFTLVKSEKYRMTKGENKSIITSSDMDKIMGYLADPAAAYTKWTSGDDDEFTDPSGVINITSVNANTKKITVQGTGSRDGVYTVTLTKSGESYNVDVTYPDGSKKKGTITGTTLTGTGPNKYVATYKENKVTITKDGTEVFSVEKKEDGSYTLKTTADDANGLAFEAYVKAAN